MTTRKTAGRPSKESLPDNVSSYLDRHGKRRYRWRKSGSKPHTFKAAYGTKEFADELAAVLAGKAGQAPSRHQIGTVAWVAARYRVSTSFNGQKNAQTERTAWLILEKFVAEFGHYKITHFNFEHIEAILSRASQPRTNDKGRLVGGPHAANNLRRELKPFFDYAIKLLRIERANPVDNAASVKTPRGGFHTWTEEEIAQYRAHHKLGTKARLALEIFLWTVQRRGDASKFGHKHLRGGKISFTPSKTKDSTGVVILIPAAPQLLAAIDAMAVVGTETFLVTDYGKPFTVAGLGNKMREWCDEAGLPQCSAHGLRKAAARRAAEQGATNQGLKAVGGWSSDRQVSVYTEAANQALMADGAMQPVIEFDRKTSKP
jgi:integrase